MRLIVTLSLIALSFLAISGCTSEGLSGLPGGAVLAQEGNANLVFVASDKGTIFLRDQPSDRIIYQGPIEKGQRLVVDVNANRTTLEGHALTTTLPLRSDATYQVFFKPSEKREYHPMMNP